MDRQALMMSQFAGLALAIALSGVAMAGSSETGSSETVSTRNVRIADLNLRSSEGAAAVYQRIAAAADAMCSVPWGIRTLGRSAIMAAQVRECKATAIKRAVAQINAPMLTAEFKSRNAKAT